MRELLRMDPTLFTVVVGDVVGYGKVGKLERKKGKVRKMLRKGLISLLWAERVLWRGTLSGLGSLD